MLASHVDVLRGPSRVPERTSAWEDRGMFVSLLRGNLIPRVERGWLRGALRGTQEASCIAGVIGRVASLADALLARLCDKPKERLQGRLGDEKN